MVQPAKAARRLKSAEGVAALLPAGASALQFPDWLTDAEQIAVDTANVVYLLRSDASLWRHDAGGDTQLADLSAQGTLLSLVPGSANKLLFTAANDTEVREADGTTGSVQTVLTLPAAGEAYLLASSAWGVIALGRDGKVYHLEGATATEIFTASFGDPWGLTLALAPEGTICWINASGEGACRAVDATQVNLGGEVFPSALGFDAAGRFYSNGFNNADNLYRGDWRRYPSEQIALIATTPAESIPGTLTITVPTPIPGTLSITAQGNVLEARRYGYDDTGRLMSEQGTPDPAQHFTYDALGNRLSDDAANDYQYDAANRLLSGNGIAYSYDANGNRKTKTEAGATTVYHYSGQNQLTGIDFPAAFAYRSARYAYDPLGRRIEKVLTNDSGAVTTRRYVYDGANLIAELDGDNHFLTEFLHGPGIDQPLAMTRGGKTYTYQADALGSILAVVDDSNAVVQRYRYDAWGNILEVQDPNFKQPFAYTGREWDEESGLYYYRARYYDPKVGRFVQSDPIGLAGGVNRYAYVEGDPVINRDPVGLLAIPPYDPPPNWPVFPAPSPASLSLRFSRIRCPRTNANWFAG